MQFIDLKTQQNLIRDKIDKRIQDVLNHGQYIMGPEVRELEEKLAEYVGTKFCISCSSGTDALLIPLMAKGIGPGDAIITTPFTYIATAGVIKLLGATPVFVDIDADSYNINPSAIVDGILIAKNKGLKPKAIIPVDLFGLPADYKIIEAVAKENNLFILEDTAQGFGGEINSGRAGSFGHIAATSFFPAKPLGCYGDGGAIFTNDDELNIIMKSVRVHGGGIDKYDNVRMGLNGRLDTLQAAILLEKLDIFPDEVTRRNRVADYYSKYLPSQFKKPFTPVGYKSSWAQYSIIAKSNDMRMKAMDLLKAKGIPSMIYYRLPLHLQKVFKYLNYQYGDFPISEYISNRIFSLPMHPYLGIDEQDQILEVLQDVK